MSKNHLLDPNFLRRQREKREAEKKKVLKAAQATTPVTPLPAVPQTRQKAIEARIQELLDKSATQSSD